MSIRKRQEDESIQGNNPSSSSSTSSWPITSDQNYPSSTSPSFTSVVPSQTYMLGSSSGTSHGRASSDSNTSSSGFGSGQKMPNELVGLSASSSSSGSAAKSSHGKARARVAMACVHCRQRWVFKVPLSF
jgi:hypothetical protein